MSNEVSTTTLQSSRDWHPQSSIMVGTSGHQTAEDFRRVLSGMGMKISKHADDILDLIPISAEEAEFYPVIHTVAELGFDLEAKLEGIFESARKRNADVCRAELGPHLREQWTENQPEGSDGEIIVAMEPVEGTDGSFVIFVLEQIGEELRLSSYCIDPECTFGPDERFLFIRRK